MTERDYPQEFLERLRAVSNLRPRRVIEHILEHGFVTTEELRTIYGYDHPPRAARDVREEGIPLDTFRVRNSQGRSIGAYRFSDPSGVQGGRLGGRRTFPRAFKNSLLESSTSRCQVCFQSYEGRYLQIDHRIPYEVSGEPPERVLEEYMLLCGSCNRAKSWSCEHCPNWTEEKDPDLCHSCYWGNPDSYQHIALRAIRRLDIVWTEDEVERYEALRRRAEELGRELPEFVKAILRNYPFQDSP